MTVVFITLSRRSFWSVVRGLDEDAFGFIIFIVVWPRVDVKNSV